MLTDKIGTSQGGGRSRIIRRFCAVRFGAFWEILDVV
jgi:hypothetical protein